MPNQPKKPAPRVSVAVTVIVTGPQLEADSLAAELALQAVVLSGTRPGCTVETATTPLESGSIEEQDIDILEGVSDHSKANLRQIGVRTIRHLLRHSRKSLYTPRRIGYPSIDAIEEALLMQFGMRLKDD